MSGIPSQSRFGCYIGNIDRSVTIDMLKQVFCQCGTILDCSLNGREGDPYRFGFIDFATEDDRARAMKYNGFTLVGRKLKVGISKGNVNKPEGFSTGNPGGTASPGHNSDRMRHGMNGAGGAGGSGHSSGPYRTGADGDAGGAGGVDGSGLTTQQQIEARLLLQFLQEGKMDPRQLSPAQQQLLIASLGQGSANVNPGSGISSGGNAAMNPMMMGASASPMLPQQAMGNPMVMMMGGGDQRMMMDPMRMPQGDYSGPNMMAPPLQQRSPQPWGAAAPPNPAAMYSAMHAHHMTPPHQQQQQQQQQLMQPAHYGASGAPVLGGGAGAGMNAPPTAETLRLREKQREQFFEVVRKDTERYERKLQEKKAQAAAGGGGGGADRSDSSASDDDEKPSKKSKRDVA